MVTKSVTLAPSDIRRSLAAIRSVRRERIIDLVRAGRSPGSLAREFEPSAQWIRNWVRQGDRDASRRADGLRTAERTELARLRRKNATLREERDILRRAAAWFARETNSIPISGTR